MFKWRCTDNLKSSLDRFIEVMQNEIQNLQKNLKSSLDRFIEKANAYNKSPNAKFKIQFG